MPPKPNDRSDQVGDSDEQSKRSDQADVFPLLSMADGVADGVADGMETIMPGSADTSRAADASSLNDANSTQPIDGSVNAQAASVRPQIGPYKILQKIAEGGMGAVYMAEQEKPIRRRVALKVIKAGKDSEQIINRFEAERQALAMMNHPNIAKVLDVGAAADGAPYFAMELVKGVPLTQYCDQNKLAIRDRLELFIPVCKAVQHAHQKGIIHRDLKPSNVLVALYDGSPVPKVIDFGLAKATEHQTQLTDKTMFTEYGAVVGTLQYMSPEQAEMNQLDVDTRTDIYSLGVMLYELLTGSTPLDSTTMGQHSLLKVLELIREKEPPRPSTRLSESISVITGVSEQRKIQPMKLKQILRGELDWVVMKSLEKDRSRRYETATAFAADIKRYLNDEPVAARPQSSRYKLNKFVRKNRILVGASAVVATLMVVAVAVSSWFAYDAKVQRIAAETKTYEAEQNRKLAVEKSEEAEQKSIEAIAERERANREKEVAQEVRTFLQESLLRNVSVWERVNARQGRTGKVAGDNVTVRQLLDTAAEKFSPTNIENVFPDKPLVQAEIMETIGDAYESLDEYEKAVKFAVASAEIQERNFGSLSPQAIDGKVNLYFAGVAAQDYDAALTAVDDALRILTEAIELPIDGGSANQDLASVEDESVKDESVGRTWERNSQTVEEMLDVVVSRTLDRMNPARFAFPVVSDQDFSANSKLLIVSVTGRLKKLVPKIEQRFGGSHEHTQFFKLFSGFCDYALGVGMGLPNVQKEAGEGLLELLHWTEKWPPERRLFKSLFQLSVGIMLDSQAIQPQRAIGLFEEARRNVQSVLPDDHPATIIYGIQLADAYAKRKQNVQAFEMYADLIPTYFSQLGVFPYVYREMVRLSVELKRTEEATATIERYYSTTLATYGQHERTFEAQRLRAYCAVRLGNKDLATQRFEELLVAATKTLGNEDELVISFHQDVAIVYHRWGWHQQALEQLANSQVAREKEFPSEHAVNYKAHSLAAKIHLSLREFDDAVASFEKSIEALAKAFGEQDERVVAEKLALIECYRETGNFNAIAVAAQGLIDNNSGSWMAADPRLPEYKTLLAEALVEQSQFSDAAKIYKSLIVTSEDCFESRSPNQGSCPAVAGSGKSRTRYG